MKIWREVITEKLEAIEKWQHYLIFHHMLRVGNPIPCSSTPNCALVFHEQIKQFIINTMLNLLDHVFARSVGNYINIEVSIKIVKYYCFWIYNFFSS